MLAGGSEAPLLPVGVRGAGQHGRAVQAQRRSDPRLAALRSRPRRLPLRRGRGRRGAWRAREHALERGATIHAEVIGAALTADAFHISRARADRPRRGTGDDRWRCADAGVAPDEIDYIVAHGTSTPLNDVTETRAIKAALRATHAYRVRHLARPSRWSATCSAPPASISALTAHRRDPRRRHPADDQPGEPRPARVRPRLRAPRGAPAPGRHGDDQRLRLRRPERGGGLPALRGLTPASPCKSSGRSLRPAP